jgi:UDP-2,3-diacylglucosamine pyrophosphatase LpxH
MVTLAISDIHLGYENANAALFTSFLQDVLNRQDVDNFVVLGDCYDLWRRDASGLFQEEENYNILQQLRQIKKVHYIVGNHDYHLKHLKDHNYPLNFVEKWDPDPSVTVNGLTCVFKHGWDFDAIQSSIMNDALCRSMSDQAGSISSEIWKWITSRQDVSNAIKQKSNEIFKPNYIVKSDTESLGKEYINKLLSTPDERDNLEKTDLSNKMANPLKSTEKNAAGNVEDGQILVFGHTHRPFINKDVRLVNTGSWVKGQSPTDVYVPYTYVEIDEKSIALKQYDKTPEGYTLCKATPDPQHETDQVVFDKIAMQIPLKQQNLARKLTRETMRSKNPKNL